MVHHDAQQPLLRVPAGATTVSKVSARCAEFVTARPLGAVAHSGRRRNSPLRCEVPLCHCVTRNRSRTPPGPLRASAPAGVSVTNGGRKKDIIYLRCRGRSTRPESGRDRNLLTGSLDPLENISTALARWRSPALSGRPRGPPAGAHRFPVGHQLRNSPLSETRKALNLRKIRWP